MNVSYTNIIIGLLVIIYVVSRQLAERPVKEDRGVKLPIILGAIGLFEIVQTIQNGHNSASITTIILLILGLASGTFFGYLRGTKIHIWYDKEQLMRKGNIVTVALWILGVSIHLTFEFISGRIDSSSAGLVSSSILLYVAITLGVQRYVTLERAKILRAAAKDTVEE